MRTLYDPAVVFEVVAAISRNIDAVSLKASLSAPQGPYSTEEWYIEGKPPE
jgi:hypothetical protein